MDTPIIFPRILFGTLHETRAAWRRVAKLAVKTDNWEAALADVPFVNISELPGEIFLEPSLYGPSTRPNESHWRIYWAISFDSLYKVPNGVNKHKLIAHLISTGMESLWFTVSMLGCKDFPWLMDPIAEKQLYLLVAEKFVRWLDEMAILAPRFSEESLSLQMHLQIGGHGWWLSRAMGRIASVIDREVWPYNSKLEIEQKYHGDCIAWLIGNDVIERTPEGLRLKMRDQ